MLRHRRVQQVVPDHERQTVPHRRRPLAQPSPRNMRDPEAAAERVPLASFEESPANDGGGSSSPSPADSAPATAAAGSAHRRWTGRLATMGVGEARRASCFVAKDGARASYLGTAVVVHVFCTALGKKPETLTHACTRVKRTCILTRMDLSVCSILAKTISVRSTAESSIVRLYHHARS